MHTAPGIRPLQRPRPPIILGASADAMIARCAHLADGLSLAGHSMLDGQKRQVAIYREALGMTMFGLRIHWVGMPHALNLKSLGLFCDKVLPALHR